MSHQLRGNIRQMRYTHQKYQCIHSCGQLIPSQRGASFRRRFMPGNHSKRRRYTAMRDRNTGISGHGHRRSHARHDFERQAQLLQCQSLFAATSENKRITALETDHTMSGLRPFHQQIIDFLLTHRMLAGGFAHIDIFSSRRSQLQDMRISQPVIDHDIGPPQALHGPQRQKSPVSRSGSHQIDTT